MKRLLYWVSITAMLCLGCDSDNDTDDTGKQSSSLNASNSSQDANSSQDDSASSGEGASSGQSNAGVSEESGDAATPTGKASGEKSAGETSASSGNDSASSAQSGAKTDDCSPACSNGYACVDQVCVKVSDVSGSCSDGAVCPEDSECRNGQCIVISENKEPDSKADQNIPCSDGAVCPEDSECRNGQCIAISDHAEPKCDNGSCSSESGDVNARNNCNTGDPCDPSSICVSDYYCLPLCGEGSDIYQNIDILYQGGISQGDEADKQGFTLIKDKASLDEFVAKHYLSQIGDMSAIENIDFSQDALLAITSGVMGIMGIPFVLDAACNIAGVQTFTAFSAFCNTDNFPAALDWKWILIRVPKDGNYDVKFVTNNHYCPK